MKKLSKRLSLDTQTVRVLSSDDLRDVQGGTNTSLTGTTIIRQTQTTGTTIINPGTTVQTGTSIISGH